MQDPFTDSQATHMQESLPVTSGHSAAVPSQVLTLLNTQSNDLQQRREFLEMMKRLMEGQDDHAQMKIMEDAF